jgi:hypothetical protein
LLRFSKDWNQQFFDSEFFFQWTGTHGSCIPIVFSEPEPVVFKKDFKEPPHTAIYPVANCVIFLLQ